MVQEVQWDLSGFEQTTNIMQPQLELDFCNIFVLEVTVLFLAHKNQKRDSEHTLYTTGPKEN